MARSEEVCGEQHPEQPNVYCERQTHAHGEHRVITWVGIERTAVVWPGKPAPPPRGKRGDRAAVIAAQVPPQEKPAGTAMAAVNEHYGRGELNKDLGTGAVLEATPDEYKRDFGWQFEALLRTGNLFTSEDITAKVGQPPNHPNAVGALMSALVKEAGKHGRIHYVMHVKATRSSANVRKIAQYRGNGKEVI